MVKTMGESRKRWKMNEILAKIGNEKKNNQKLNN